MTLNPFLTSGLVHHYRLVESISRLILMKVFTSTAFCIGIPVQHYAGLQLADFSLVHSQWEVRTMLIKRDIYCFDFLFDSFILLSFVINIGKEMSLPGFCTKYF